MEYGILRTHDITTKINLRNKMNTFLHIFFATGDDTNETKSTGNLVQW